jgi:hypothetical protein
MNLKDSKIDFRIYQLRQNLEEFSSDIVYNKYLDQMEDPLADQMFDQLEEYLLSKIDWSIEVEISDLL